MGRVVDRGVAFFHASVDSSGVVCFVCGKGFE